MKTRIGEETHNKKHRIAKKANQNKGVTPIEKNIIVVDEQGNEYEATYPKRAKGLMKNGRARFVDENKICLACPPDSIMEDNKMTNTNKKQDSEIISDAKKAAQEAVEFTKVFEEEFEKSKSDSIVSTLNGEKQQNNYSASAFALLEKIAGYTEKCITIALSNPEIDSDDSDEILEAKMAIVTANRGSVALITQTLQRLASIVEKCFDTLQ